MDARRARSQGLTPEECVCLLLSIVSALQALHTSSPHGPRPENALVTARGALSTHCVLGVSFPPDRLHQRIAAGLRPRAADYNAPELALGRRPTASADLFALGAMAAELAGGKALSEGPDLALISVELPPPRGGHAARPRPGPDDPAVCGSSSTCSRRPRGWTAARPNRRCPCPRACRP